MFDPCRTYGKCLLMRFETDKLYNVYNIDTHCYVATLRIATKLQNESKQDYAQIRVYASSLIVFFDSDLNQERLFYEMQKLKVGKQSEQSKNSI